MLWLAAKALFFINISSDSSAAAQESLCSLRFGAKVWQGVACSCLLLVASSCMLPAPTPTLPQINATTIGVPRPCLVERPDSKQRS